MRRHLVTALAGSLLVLAAGGADAAFKRTSRLAVTPPAVTVEACTAPATRVVPVSTATALTSALSAALPGDRIVLADGRYAGRFTLARSGTSTARIRVCGGQAAVLDGGATTTGYGFSLRASDVDLVGFTVTNSQKGVMADGVQRVVLDRLTVHTIGDEAVHLRKGSSDNVVSRATIHHTGLREPLFGEGVYVGSASNNWCSYTACQPDRSDRNVVRDSTFYALGADAVDAKEGTTGGRVERNRFDGTGSQALSWVDVKGNGWTVRDNTGVQARRDGFLTSVAVVGWGTGNTYRGNVADVRTTGYGINARAGDVVGCDNRVLNAAKGLSTLLCAVLAP